MIELPEKLSKSNLRKSFKKGDVIFWENFDGKEEVKDSFFVLLTDCNNDMFIVVRATSKVEFYSGPDRKRLKHDWLKIKKGSCPLFSKETALDFTWMDYFSVEDMYRLVGSGIRKKGTLSEHIMQKVEETVKNAKTVSKADKDKILK